MTHFRVWHDSFPCNTLQHTKTHCNIHTGWAPQYRFCGTLCYTLQHTATHCKLQMRLLSIISAAARTAIYCNLWQQQKLNPQHDFRGTSCNTLQHTKNYCNNIQVGLLSIISAAFKRNWAKLMQVWSLCAAIIAVCCSGCSVLQRVAVCAVYFSDVVWWNASGLSGFMQDRRVLQCIAVCCRALLCAVLCCSVLRCHAVCCSVMQNDHMQLGYADACKIAMCRVQCDVMQCVAVWHSVFQCVAETHQYKVCITATHCNTLATYCNKGTHCARCRRKEMYTHTNGT